MDAVIRTTNLTKAYDGRVTINRLNLTVQPGEIYGFLGPNGAGKTTTIRMILGLIPPTSGSVQVMGTEMSGDSAALRRYMGVVGEQTFLYDDMTALEYLTFFARLYHVENHQDRIGALLEQLDLTEYTQLLARDFSQGMQKKLSLARALLHSPEILILDEPNSGLDPYGILQVRELLLEERKRGKSVLISSHILAEVERTADRVGILQKGKLVVEDSVAAVGDRLAVGVELEIELQRAVPGLAERLRNIAGVSQVGIKGCRVSVHGQRDEELRAAVSQTIVQAGGVVIAMNAKKASLEDAFVRLTEGC